MSIGVPQELIWATRGRTWGFRFLLDGGLADPLKTYERAFEGFEGEDSVCAHTGGMVALRFADPDGRRDAAGRLIAHDFVVRGAEAEVLASIQDGLAIVWPLVRDAYENAWGVDRPPQTGRVDS